MAITPSLAMIPSGYKAQKLYSAVPTNGDGDFDFARNSAATRVNKDGLIEEVAVNVPRLDYSDGGCPSLLLEPSRNNLIPYSEDFTTWSQSGWTLTSGLLSPNGGLNAYSVLRTTGSSFTQSLTLSADTTYTFTSYIKNVNATNIQLRVQNQAGNTSGTESNCIVFSVTDQTNDSDFTRITHTFNTGDAGSYILFLGYYSAGEYIVWGAQLEQGSYPTSYIPNYGTYAGITRVAETANGAGDASTFNDSEGVLMVEISALVNDGNTFKGISLNNGSVSNLVILYVTPANNTIRAIVQSGGVRPFDKTYIVPNVKDSNKIAIKYKTNDFALWVNSVKVATDLSGANPIGLNKLSFDEGTGTEKFYGNVKDVRVYTTALSDAELQALTS